MRQRPPLAVLDSAVWLRLLDELPADLTDHVRQLQLRHAGVLKPKEPTHAERIALAQRLRIAWLESELAAGRDALLTIHQIAALVGMGADHRSFRPIRQRLPKPRQLPRSPRGGRRANAWRWSAVRKRVLAEVAPEAGTAGKTPIGRR